MFSIPRRKTCIDTEGSLGLVPFLDAGLLQIHHLNLQQRRLRIFNLLVNHDSQRPVCKLPERLEMRWKQAVTPAVVKGSSAQVRLRQRYSTSTQAESTCALSRGSLYSYPYLLYSATGIKALFFSFLLLLIPSGWASRRLQLQLRLGSVFLGSEH